MKNYNSTNQQVYTRPTQITFAKAPSKSTLVSWQQCDCIIDSDGSPHVISDTLGFGGTSIDVDNPTPFQLFNPNTGEAIDGQFGTYQQILILIYSIWKMNQEVEVVEQPVNEEIVETPVESEISNVGSAE